MTIEELIKQLNSYDDDMNVKVFDDYGSSFSFRAIEQVIDITEIEDNPNEEFVIITLE